MAADPFQRKLRTIAADLRVVGLALIVFGGHLSEAIAVLMTLSIILILLGPGAWFALASSLLASGNGRLIVGWSIRIAIGQLIGCGAALLFTLIGANRFGAMLAPAVVLLFFVPAQAVLMFRLIQARGLIAARDAARGFAVADQPIAVPVAMAVASPADPSPADGSPDAAAFAEVVDDIPSAQIVKERSK